MTCTPPSAHPSDGHESKKSGGDEEEELNAGRLPKDLAFLGKGGGDGPRERQFGMMQVS